MYICPVFQLSLINYCVTTGNSSKLDCWAKAVFEKLRRPYTKFESRQFVEIWLKMTPSHQFVGLYGPIVDLAIRFVRDSCTHFTDWQRIQCAGSLWVNLERLDFAGFYLVRPLWQWRHFQIRRNDVYDPLSNLSEAYQNDRTRQLYTVRLHKTINLPIIHLKLLYLVSISASFSSYFYIG